MSINNSLKNALPLAQIIGSNVSMLEISPSILFFLSNYMSKFQIRKAGNNLVLHSHLPPLNSTAYSRFVQEHLLAKTPGPSHAQIGITNACPQRCEYCYNRNRQGRVMDTDTILKTAAELKRMGVVWLGLTGGEPLLNKDLVKIVGEVSGDCAVKLFTTGCTLTHEKASDLKKAGLFSVSVSLDHWDAEKHDSGRGYKGAFQQALMAIELFQSVGGIHVGVSAVLSRDMIQHDQAGQFLDFLNGLGAQEAWLSEVKPSLEAFWDDKLVITEEDRMKLVKLQDSYNSRGNMTVNYLGHFEGKEHFGCNAGNKMIYIDSFGEVSPCVFTPLTFGNVQSVPVTEIFNEMRQYFPSESGCFMNKNFKLLQKHSGGQKILGKAETVKLLEEVNFGGLSTFNQLYNKSVPKRTTYCRSGLKPQVAKLA